MNVNVAGDGEQEEALAGGPYENPLLGGGEGLAFKVATAVA